MRHLCRYKPSSYFNPISFPKCVSDANLINLLYKFKTRKNNLLLTPLCINNTNHLFALWRRRQILISIFGDENVIFDTDTSDAVVALEDILVDELGVIWVTEIVAFNVLTAEITKRYSCQYKQ